ncbi:MAG: hypothetical protein CSA42_00315 [Gammaproteobacteria bacterium]|nr:MAG: hypothetical protein CSB21_00015 [Deltaproteobacteria bacterium]PIE48131.1 MAG: hypothetical protein CSA42_00315 [Gammaproteobacteria bacterium]
MDNINSLIEILDKSFGYFKTELFFEPGIELVEKALIKIALDKNIISKIPGAFELAEKLSQVQNQQNFEERETLLIDLYLLLHKFGCGYSDMEQNFISEKKGIKWLPGGIMPIILTSYLMNEDYVFADLGAGNGLQGLILQSISPHKKTRLIEISESHLMAGRAYAKALGFNNESILFENNDILSSDFKDIDIFYMYRPARPMNGGKNFYIRLSEKFEQMEKEFFLVSVADCFEPFIKQDCLTVYSNEFMKVFLFR